MTLCLRNLYENLAILMAAGRPVDPGSAEISGHKSRP